MRSMKSNGSSMKQLSDLQWRGLSPKHRKEWTVLNDRWIGTKDGTITIDHRWRSGVLPTAQPHQHAFCFGTVSEM